MSFSRFFRRIACASALASTFLAFAPAVPTADAGLSAQAYILLKVEFWWGHVCATNCPDGAGGSPYCCSLF